MDSDGFHPSEDFFGPSGIRQGMWGRPIASRALAVGSGRRGVKWPLEMGGDEGPGQRKEGGTGGIKI